MKQTVTYQFNDSEMFAGYVWAVATLVRVEADQSVVPVESIGCYFPVTTSECEIFSRIRTLAVERFGDR